MKKFLIGVLILTLVLVTTACSSNASGSGSANNGKKALTVVWYPNESGADMKTSRQALDKVIAQATGKKVIDKLTTDYNIAIEAVASGNADIGFLAAQGYIEAHKKNSKVLPLVVNTGGSGTLKDAVYYSWISVRAADASKYQTNGKYSLDNIAGKKMSFVSTASTSGFIIPTAQIIHDFKSQSKYKNLSQNDLTQGGKFFSQVLFGQTHQGSAVNLLTGKVDVAAFCDTELERYVDVASGTFDKPGTTYKVKSGAPEPFNNLAGKEFTALTVTPVLNAPIVMNTSTLSKQDQQKLISTLTSDKVANDKSIFAPANSSAMFFKTGKNDRFVKINDAWFDPIRKLSE
ncbi:PhnD/SsuA/transferrin family substrate-binding protein [Sporolactobacillus sp. CQH2019]|uniref:PhnD/SsuA/transferrin family substrate-binding protein n=1 Tax=Sporolactobacillus sp. CQH2019 TaxID=3023512 RepID=UPI002368ED2F|nr:PhnD/SsuA/transferrin family substrate-binding protein [Sporolactobacillus sp. CQH2019]MDD9150028.1 PhnD/SsuA/transferrin family substrate-binding protein [Sporolactobacillus sp. CQH2019]